jgi:hypothetical protein
MIVAWDDVIGMYGEPNTHRTPNAPGHCMLRYLRSSGMVAVNGRDHSGGGHYTSLHTPLLHTHPL